MISSADVISAPTIDARCESSIQLLGIRTTDIRAVVPRVTGANALLASGGRTWREGTSTLNTFIWKVI